MIVAEVAVTKHTPASPSESERCISCDRPILVDEPFQHMQGFPIHVSCYERELGLRKDRGQKPSGNDDR